MKLYLCKIAWRVLWKWWPDRVYIAAVPGEIFTTVLEAGTPNSPHYDTIQRATYVWEKLDHGGKLVKRNTEWRTND